jgi:uncharacterized membrane protein YdbT with pleckstrin-like domain
MFDDVRECLCRWLRVPPKPAPPHGSPESIRVFRAAPNFYKWCVLTWAITQLGVAAGLGTSVVFLDRAVRKAPPWVYVGWKVLEAAAGFVAQLPFSFLKQKLDYEMRWYIVTDRSLRIRSGIWQVQEMTMTFANIQHIGVKQGPLQRVLGLADVEVSSAGGGKTDEHEKQSGHVAAFEGIDNAGEVRDLMVKRLKQYRDAGLGDPDAGAHAPLSEIDAARELLSEASALRAVVEKS